MADEIDADDVGGRTGGRRDDQGSVGGVSERTTDAGDGECELPVRVLVAVLTVRMEEEPAATEVGLKVPVAPAGRPVRLKAAEPEKPFRAPTLTV